MNQTWTIELFVYLATALSALLLLPRSANWRLRLVVGTIGMQALAQAMGEMKVNHPFWQSRLGTLAGSVELLGGAFALTAIYLLKKENRERKSTDARLRLSEATEHLSGLQGPSKSSDSQPASNPPNDVDKNTVAASTSVAALEASVAAHSSPAHGDRLPKSGVHPSDADRKVRRFPISSTAKVTLLEDQHPILDAKLEDISQGGTRVWLLEPIQPGTLLKIEFREYLFLGEVRSCGEVEGRFVVGVHFCHMLDLANLSRILREIGVEVPATMARRESA